MNNLIQALQEEYYAFHNKEMEASKALKLFKSLPSAYDDSIINNDEETFRFLIKQEVAYLGFTRDQIKQTQFKVLSQVIKREMERYGITYHSVGHKVGLSERTVYDFVENNHPLNSKHLQDILFQFGLALAPVTNAEFAEKYLQVVPETPPVVEEPVEDAIPETPTEDSEPPTEPVEDATPEQPTDTEPVTEGGDEVVEETEEVIEPVVTP